MISIPNWLFQNFNGDPFHRGPHSPTSSTKSWHNQVSDSVRQHFIETLVSVFSKNQQEEFIQEIKKCEEEMFEVADSRDEYYRMVVKKIKQVQKQHRTGPTRYY